MGHTDHAGHKSMTPDAAAHANHAGMDHGSVPHTATGDPEQNPVAASHPEYIALSDGAAPWGSDLLQPSDSYSYIFDVPGEYKYICIRHVMSGMRGTIVVEE
ncbi:MAG: cupredoxin domain-containing protein [Thermomicrobiales bacterium]